MKLYYLGHPHRVPEELVAGGIQGMHHHPGQPEPEEDYDPHSRRGAKSNPAHHSTRHKVEYRFLAKEKAQQRAQDTRAQFSVDED